MISSANVSKLQQAWAFRITTKPDGGVGALAMSPVVAGDIVFIQDMQANVYAVDFATGKLRWDYQINTTELGRPGRTESRSRTEWCTGRHHRRPSRSAPQPASPSGWIGICWPRARACSTSSPRRQPGRSTWRAPLAPGQGGGILLALNAATGKLRWYYQAVPNDFQDHDLQTSPIAASIDGTSVVIAAGEMRYVYAINAESGALLWKTPVGKHNGHDNDGVLALEHKLHLKAPVTIDPGPLGGVLSNPAVADNTGYVSTVDEPIVYTKLTQGWSRVTP